MTIATRATARLTAAPGRDHTCRCAPRKLFGTWGSACNLSGHTLVKRAPSPPRQSGTIRLLHRVEPSRAALAVELGVHARQLDHELRANTIRRLDDVHRTAVALHDVPTDVQSQTEAIVVLTRRVPAEVAFE